MSRTRRRMLLTSAAMIALATPAHSQDDAGDARRDEIYVTAQKREQTLQEIPQSVSVVGGEELDRLKATNFQEYLALVPGLQLEQSTPGVGRLILRGVNTGGVASTVAVYVDETPFGSSTGLVNAAILAGDFDTFDVDRIEVLRGPQGTLYGANSLGGVLRFVTAEPNTDGVELRLRGGVETVKDGEIGYSGAGVANLPLTETLAIRGSGFYRKNGGFIDSIGTNGSDVAEDINGSESFGGRVSALFEPSDGFSIRLSALHQELNTDESSQIDVDSTTLEPITPGELTRSRYAAATNEVAYRVYNGTVEWDIGGASLLSSTSYNLFDQTIHSDFFSFAFAPTVAAIFMTPPLDLVLDQQTDQRKFTQELRLASEESDRFEWMLGGYYTRETGLIDQLVTGVNEGTLTPAPAVPLLAATNLDSEYKEIAAFANATIFFGENFDLTLGGRYSHNKQEATQTSGGFPGLFVGGPATFSGLESDEGVFTWSAAPRYEFSDNFAVYARVAKGFRPGGPNVLPPNVPAGTPLTYQSDTVVSYETGLKTQSLDGSFALDLALFYVDWKDIQLFTVINGFGVNANGGGAHSKGGELTASLFPFEGLSLLLNAAYTEAELTVDTSPLVGGSDGDLLPFTPKYMVGLSGDYEWPIGNAVDAYFGGTFRFQSSQNTNFVAGGGQMELPSYKTLDLRTGLLFDRFSVEVYARNLANSQGLTSGGTPSPFLPPGVSNAGVLRPRTVGLTLTAEW